MQDNQGDLAGYMKIRTTNSMTLLVGSTMTIRIDPEDPTHVAGDPETYLNLILLLSLFLRQFFLQS